ncbi:MAG: 30S ribosomal protein S8e [Candidatus Aenigmarchaeota archaeon]|nr:30S ribosomal protein S8e [Candidatus Aenigmarchaeota archaeon]
MVKWHLKSQRKPTGGKLQKHKKKKKYERGSKFLEPKVGEISLKIKRARGGNRKLKLLSVNEANVSDPTTRKVKKVKILSVEKNPANPHFVRRNIVTKGAIIKTEIGLAKVTSRPGQNGIVNAVLMEDKK